MSGLAEILLLRSTLAPTNGSACWQEFVRTAYAQSPGDTRAGTAQLAIFLAPHAASSTG